ncbi:MAG: MFS transporter [Fimbriimonas ginsengisoli]|uniref:MFS transporter n=1 Tax=Fimbriimonas ginsengisoli TaxID=1005039 RepID=A0A931LSD3_FIMGI|nr:MFS transporter [Fimbriimonas ginsengisoli]
MGWAFDGLDGFLYSLVAVPFVKELLGGASAGMPEVAKKAALIQAVFLFGWALGGAFFGRIGDKIGRTHTLTLTILTYALFTGLSFFSQAWWHLMIFRFVAALGIGGEWAAGSSLVSETLHPKHKAWASATLQTGYMAGMILASLTVSGLVGSGAFPHRAVFLVGVLPALATVWIRRAVPEPEEWKGAREHEKMPSVAALFSPAVRKVTLLTLSMTSICLTTVWAFLFFTNQVLRALPEVKALAVPEQERLITGITIVWVLWNIAGNYAATYLAKFTGYRRAMAVMLVFSFVSYYLGFREPLSLEATRWWFNIAAFFSLGIFALFPLYIPPLFPTLLRTTGAGFCYNFGRIVAAGGALVGGQIIAGHFPGLGIWWLGFLYIPGILLALVMPEHGPGMHGEPELATAPAV